MQWLLTGGIDALVDARDANVTYLMRFQTRLTAEISGSEGSGGTASSNRSPSSLNEYNRLCLDPFQLGKRLCSTVWTTTSREGSTSKLPR